MEAQKLQCLAIDSDICRGCNTTMDLTSQLESSEWARHFDCHAEKSRRRERMRKQCKFPIQGETSALMDLIEGVAI